MTLQRDTWSIQQSSFPPNVRYDATAHAGLIPSLEFQFPLSVEELFQAFVHVMFALSEPTSVEATVNIDEAFVLEHSSFECKARCLMKRNAYGRTHDLFET